MLSGGPETIRRARALRREMSFSEVLLWIELKKRPSGLKFRRQQPASRMVTDFYGHAARLIVEVDGAAHDSIEVAESDARRDAWFARRGLRVLRIPAEVVLHDRVSAMQAIVLAADVRSPLRHRAMPDGAPSFAGEHVMGACNA